MALALAVPVAAAKTVSVKDWSGSVCKGHARWDARLTTLGRIGRLADPSAGKAALTTYLTGAAHATDRLAKGLKSAGVPAVKDGQAIATAFADSVEVLRAAYAKATTDAAALPTTDPVAFATAARVLAAQLQTTGTTLNDTLATTAQKYPASAVVKAFRSTKACRAFV